MHDVTLLSGTSGLSLDSTLILSRLSFFYPYPWMSDVFLTAWNLRSVIGFHFNPISSLVFSTPTRGCLMSSLLSGISGLSLDSTLILSRLSFFYQGMSEVSLLSGISGLSLDSRFLSPHVFFEPVLFVWSFFCRGKNLHVGIFACCCQFLTGLIVPVF